MKRKISYKQLNEVKEILSEKVPDFALKIQHVYQLFEWEWKDKGIPTVQEIRASLYRHISDLNNSPMAVSSGGLSVWIEKKEAGMDFTVSEEVYF